MNTAVRWATLFGVSASILACGDSLEGVSGKQKPTVSDDGKDGLDRYDAVSSSAGTGDWQELRIVESAHPYTNNFANTYSVNGSAGATEMKVVFDRFELEQDYDFLSVSSASGDNVTRHTGTKASFELVVPGDRVDLRLTSDGSVTGYGFKARVFERKPCVCPAVYNPLCGADGNTYSNACAAQCAGVATAYAGACASVSWTPTRQTLESPHPYTNNLNRSFPVSFAGARQIRLHFSRIDTERGYDFVRILDGAGNMVHEYTGRALDVTTPAIRGSALTVVLASDASVTNWGFAVDRVEVVAGCQVNADCGAGETCTQVQCIAAPCFNVCSPAVSTGYQEVTLAALQANPAAFDGRKIEVVSTPALGGTVCTRIACSQANPCCNRCSAAFSIGGDIALEGAAGNFGCSGNECNVQSSCNPQFPATGAGDYAFRGVFHSEAFGAKRLVVDDFRAQSCQPGGCGGELCSNAPMFSTCVARPEAACYRGATCAAQSNGMCGWTQTPELTQCLANGGSSGRSFTSRDTPLSIPDNSATGITSRVEVSGASAGRTVKVSLAITHSYRGDLRVVLTAPNGRERVLSDRAGGSFDDLVLENVDVTALTAGAAANGAWRLKVTDGAAQDTGALNQWSLTVE